MAASLASAPLLQKKHLAAETETARKAPGQTLPGLPCTRCWARGSAARPGRGPPRRPAAGNGPAGCSPSPGRSRGSDCPRRPRPTSLRPGPGRPGNAGNWGSRTASNWAIVSCRALVGQLRMSQGWNSGARGTSRNASTTSIARPAGVAMVNEPERAAGPGSRFGRGYHRGRSRCRCRSR